MGEKGEGSGMKGRGTWEWGTPLSTPSFWELLKLLKDIKAYRKLKSINRLFPPIKKICDKKSVPTYRNRKQYISSIATVLNVHSLINLKYYCNVTY